MITKYIKGNVAETELEYIAHGVNCQNKMGAGVAKILYEKYPEVKYRYHAYCKDTEINKRLGTITTCKTEKGKTIFNCFTQFNYGWDGKKYVNYAAIVKCFSRILDFNNCKILAIPKIGCSLGGGDWNIVEQLINDTVGDELEIWVYEV